MTLHERRCWKCHNVAMHEDSVTPYVLCKKCGSQDTRRTDKTDSGREARESWKIARAELLRRIEEKIQDQPDEFKSIWYLKESEGDMSEFANMLKVIDAVLGAESLNYQWM